ncbi:MAG: hypothetical protein OXP71_17660 [Candidatus Poribacteria bacterium]|nr:hypothetical protein [Candidatus Poribacteria bacterium]
MTDITHYTERRDALWKKCSHCDEPVFNQVLKRHFYTCPHCDHYSPMPAEERLFHLFDTEPLMNLYPPLAPESLLESLELMDFVSHTTFPDELGQLIAAGDGTISGHPAILAVVHPYSVPQRGHFVTLLTCIRASLQKNLPLITVYPSDGLAKRKSDEPKQSELTPAEITHLKIELDGLSQARLPQITALTDIGVTGGFSTRFPLGDLVVSEQKKVVHRGDGIPNLSDSPQSDVLIDLNTQRQELPTLLGKLLAFFADKQTVGRKATTHEIHSNS